MADIKLKRFASLDSLLSTDLNSLANNAGSALSAAVTNETDLCTHAILELAVDFVSAPTAESLVEIYLVPEVDSTNYADYTSGTTPVASATHLVGAFILKATTAAQRLSSPIIELPATDFKIAVINKSGQAFPASGSTVKMQRWFYQSA